MTYQEINIIYEDNHILVVVKPQNIATQGDSSGDENLLDLLKEYLKETYQKPGNAFLGLVHRLDRPTGGVMVFAKTSKAAERICEMMQTGVFEKRYLAVVCGQPKNKKGRLTHYLLKNEAKNMVMPVPMATQGAKKAELDYRVLDDYAQFSLVDIKLLTGRSHQARVQMQQLGTPICGDVKYGGMATGKLALWAYEIKFLHPISKETMTFRVFPPQEEKPWSFFDLNLYLNLNIRNA